MKSIDADLRPNTVIATAREVLEEGIAAVLVTVIEGENVGAKMLITKSGERSGTFADANLDGVVQTHAFAFLEMRDEARTFKLSEFAPELAQFAGTKILFERLEAEPRLVIAGAGHVGASLARLAALVGYDVTLIDDRAEFVARELFQEQSAKEIQLVAAQDWQEAMRTAVRNGRGVSVAIVTRGHKQDEDCLRATLTAGPDYIGMIGSKRRINIVLQKLRDEGFAEEKLKRVHAPIGLDIGAVSPEEVALAILAEIVAERRGGVGTPLSNWRRP
jgi:xanthine dehydrogenase accessory factor